MSATTSKLFAPTCVGRMQLSHRLVLAPLTRCRANSAHVHGDLAVKYYAQRACEPGTFLISEATIIAQHAGGYRNVPGIWSDEQVAAWKRVTDAVHAQGLYIYIQLWAPGRAAFVDALEEEDPGSPYVSSSNVPLTGRPIPPRPLTVTEIREYVQLFAAAAANAVHRAGFDGVELHAANGYLIDQFIQNISNKRTDEYGGSVENRSRFALEIVDAVSKEIGQDRTGVRLSPWGLFNDMRGSEDPKPQFSYVVQQLAKQFPELAYLHLVEPRSHGDNERPISEEESNDFLREIWKRPLISAGGYNRTTAFTVAQEKGDLISFGRYWISNPDLPRRIKDNTPLTHYDRSTFYSTEDPHGYTDYPFANYQESFIL